MNWSKSSASDLARRVRYAELVAAKYEQEFGDRLTVEQILSPETPSTIFTETNAQGEMIAGVKLAPLADSFSAQCVGEKRLKEILGDIPVDQVVEVSKAVNLGGMIVGSRLIARCYQWIDENSDYGFVSVGTRKKAELYKWLLMGSWHKPWDVEIYSVPEPEIQLPEHIDLVMLWAKPKTLRGIKSESDPVFLDCKLA